MLIFGWFMHCVEVGHVAEDLKNLLLQIIVLIIWIKLRYSAEVKRTVSQYVRESLPTQPEYFHCLLMSDPDHGGRKSLKNNNKTDIRTGC